MQAVLATLGYVLSPDRRQVLLIRRDRRPSDLAFGKYNGLGGKLEPGEDVCAGMRREIREEAGIECDQMRLAGTISWPGFGRNAEAWFGFLFVIDAWSGTPKAENEEGSLHWCDVDDLVDGRLPVWEGDRWFLPLVLGADARPDTQFHGVLPYDQGHPVSWNYTTLPGPVTSAGTGHPTSPAVGGDAVPPAVRT